MQGDIERILVSEEELCAKVAQLGEQISRDYIGKDLVLIGILNGSVVFLSDLMRKITLPLEIDFMRVSSYGNSSESSGIVKIQKDLDKSISGKDVIIVEDIIDSGRTLAHLCKVFEARDVRSIKICTLLNKPDRRVTDVLVDYEGFVIPDEFVVGYGLDYDDKYRNIPYIGVLKREVYE